MPEARMRTGAQRHARMRAKRSVWALIAVSMLAVLALLLVVMDVRPGGPGDGTPPSAVPSSETDSGSEETEGTGEVETSPAQRPALVPFSAVQTIPMTFPGKERSESRSFSVSAGEKYLLRFDVDAEKPAKSDGHSFMLGVSLDCTDEKGRSVASLGGTENLLTGDPVTFSNQVVLAPERDAVYTCSMLANAPDAELAARGTSFSVHSTWKVEKAVGIAAPGAHVGSLPRVIPEETGQEVLRRDIPVAALTQRELEVLVSLQLTTCTGPGGSTEGGTQWCTPDVIDPTGSHFRFEVRFDVIGADGKKCGTIDSGRRHEYLNTYQHHQLYHVEKSIVIPSDLCGDRIRTSVNLRNSGPAGLLVHENATSMVTLENRRAV